MTIRYVERATRNHPRQRGFGFDAFDRCMDNRERRAARHGATSGYLFGTRLSERPEIERRSLVDTCAPTRS